MSMAYENEPDFTPGITGNISDSQASTPSDPENYIPFNGERPLLDPQINFTNTPFPPISRMPAQSVRPVIGSPDNNRIGAQGNQSTVSDYTRGVLADFDATEGKNNYAKIYSYDSGQDSNAFYERYASFGDEKLKEVGFSPIRDNESNFNASTTWWDNAQRMLTHSFLPLVGLGLKTGIKSMGRMLQGDFTGADLEEAEEYKYYSALGQDSRGGAGAFFNNALMNFGYTGGIIIEAIAEEVALGIGNAVTGGSLIPLQAKRTLDISQRLGRASKLFQMPKAVKSTLQSMNNINKSRNFWKAVNSPTGRFLNPLENTLDAIQGIRKSKRQGEYLHGLAQFSRTAGGFYRDVRNINMAVAESRLESGMVINEAYDQGYREFYNRTGRAPNNEEQRFIRAIAEKKGLETFWMNAPAIYLTNKIVFNNITRPRGGLSRFLRNTREEIYQVGASAGEKNFGNIGRLIYDNTKKAFVFEKNNLKNLAKSWWKNPGFKTAKKTLGYFKANVSEGLQENYQEAVARANEESAKEALNSAFVQSTQYSNGVINWTLKDQSSIPTTSWDTFKTELGKEWSARGFETFATGFLMGTFAAPLNAAPQFLSVQYNRMFNKSEYKKWIETKTNITQNIAQELNNVDLNEFLSNRIINLGVQGNVSQIKDSVNTSTKENFDTDVESFISQVNLMHETGTTEIFIDKLNSMKELTDEELLDAIPGEVKESAQFYRDRLDKSVNKLKTIEKRFEEAEEMFPNPVSKKHLDKSNTYDYNSQVLLYHAWNKAVENYVFFSESFEDVGNRMKSIQETYLQDSNIGESDYGAAKVLFTPENIGEQKTILEQEIDTEQQKDVPNNTRIAALKDQMKSLDDFQKAFSEFRKFYIRDDFRNQARQILQSQKAEGETVTDEEIEEYLDEELGPLDDEQKQTEILRNLRSAHHNYLKAVAKGVNTTVFDKALEDGFNKLVDYYKLGQESRAMAEGINVLHDPAGFLDLVDKNQRWMRRLYDRRSEYYIKLVNDQISLVEDNAFLNQLANQGLYVSAEDFAEYKKSGVAPSEIFDNINKVVYKKGTPQYTKIYRELFIPYEHLKDLTVKEAALFNDEIFNAKLKDLNKMYDDKIANLPLEPTRVTLVEFPAEEGKRYKFKDLIENLGNEQTLQAVYSETEDPVLFYKDAQGNIRFVDAQGDIANVDEINKEFDFLSAEIFNIQELPNQDIVEAINAERKEALENLLQSYIEDEDIEESTKDKEEEVIIFSTDTPVDQMPAALRNALFVEFNKTLTAEEKDTLTEEQQENLFDKFIKQGSFEVKKIIDDYNQKEADKRDLKVAGDVKKDFEFQFNGKTIDTKGKTVPTLRALQTQLKLRVESLEEKKTLTPEQKKNLTYFKVQIKNLEGVINARTRAGLTPAQLAAIEKIQELKSKQPKYTVDSKGYNIAGKDKPYKRVTSVINQFLDDYQYRDKDKVIEIFNRTLGQDIKAIDAFIDEISAAGLAGVEPYTIRELRARLPEALEGAAEMAAMEQAAIGLSDLVPELEGAEEVADKEDVGTLGKFLLIDETIEEGEPGYGGSTVVGVELTKQEKREKVLIEGTEAYKAAEELVKSDPKRYRLSHAGSVFKYKTSRTQRITVKGKSYKVNIYRFEDGKVLYSISALDEQGLPIEDVKAQDIFDTAADQTIEDTVVNLVGELTYESSRVTGNYIDQAVKDLFDKGIVPKFDENQISREAYDNLFGSEGYLTELKRRVDNGEIYIASTGIVVYDDALGIAGEIDLLVADRKGNITIVDIKTGEAGKWRNFFKKGNKYSKLENYGLQQTAYANLLNRMIGIDANIALLPIQITKSTAENTDGKIETANKPSAANLLTTEYLIALNKADFAERINSVIPVEKVTSVTKKSSLFAKDINNQSSEDQDNEELENALDQPVKGVKMTKNELKEYRNFEKRISNAKTIDQLNQISNDISMAMFQQLIPVEALNDLNLLIQAQRFIIEGVGIEPGTETLDSIEIGKPFMARIQIVQTKGKNKGDIFAEQYDMVKIIKIDGNKITIANSNGNKMTISLENLNDNYRSEESLEQPEKESTEDNEKKGQETISSTSELLADQNKMDEINNSDDDLKDAEDDLLDDLDC